jgi:hypothetical protein
MYRHELRLVLRFGVRDQFNELAQRLHHEETAHALARPRIWRATSSHPRTSSVRATSAGRVFPIPAAALRRREGGPR